MTYRLLENIEAKRTSLGMLTKGASPNMVRHMVAGGLDFIIVDMMHSKVGWDEAAQLCWVARADGMYPFIRIPSHPWGTGAPIVNRQFAVDAIRALSTCSEGVMWSISSFEEAELVAHMGSDWHQGIPVTSQQQVSEVQAGGLKRRPLIPLIESLGALERVADGIALHGLTGGFMAVIAPSHPPGAPPTSTHTARAGAV